MLQITLAVVFAVVIIVSLYFVFCGVSHLVMLSADQPLTVLEADVVNKEISPRLALVGLARDAMRGMPTLRRLHDAFQPSLMFFMENNSQDNTRAYLEAWQKEDDRVVVGSPMLAVDTFRQADHSKRRIDRMVSLRNQCMGQFWSLCRERKLQPEVVMIIDPDSVLQMDLRDLASAIRYVQTHDVSALSPNVLISRRLVPFWQSPRDPFAFAEMSQPDGPQTSEQPSKQPPKQPPKQPSKHEKRKLRPVLSAFGIFTLYKNTAVLRSTKYAHSVSENDGTTECEHVDFHRRLARASGFPVLFAPAWKVWRKQWV